MRLSRTLFFNELVNALLTIDIGGEDVYLMESGDMYELEGSLDFYLLE